MTEFKKESKYLVLKREDIDKYLSIPEKTLLTGICQSVFVGRENEGKKDNSYIVVNNDETYSDDVWDLIKTNPHT